METELANDAPTPTPKRRRTPRAMLACERCRLKKYKCSEAQPCAHCKRSGAECKYARSYRALDDRVSLASGISNAIQQAETSAEEPSPRPQSDGMTNPATSRNLQPALTPPDSLISDRTGSRSTNQPHTSVSDGRPPAASPSEESEIAEVNQHTNGIEYHGNTSSMSFLGSLQRLREQRTPHFNPSERGSFSLVSALHNPGFVSRRNFTSDITAALASRGFYSKRAHTFIEGYFSGIHYVHPIIDKEDFLSRADELWRVGECGDVHFVALYLSVLSLGALTRTWDEKEMDGLDRFQWSRKLFSEAQALLNEIQFTNGLGTIQCFYVMAKICQNELNPNLAYMYLGWAIRSCLAAGFNRETPTPNAKNGSTMSRIWWGLYSLEIEMSFLLGRPDTLGQDEYHNRAMPPIDDSEYSIIPTMVEFGRIMRKVSIKVYHSRLPPAGTVGLAFGLSREMDQWFEGLPQRRGSSLKEPEWRRKQRLVLELRYHNVRMLLFRPFLAQNARSNHAPDGLMAAVGKCISSAQETIKTVYDAYKVHTYFQTWWYNTTYITIAASVLLLYESQTKESDKTSNIALIKMAVEILEVMDESVVARNAAEVIRHFMRELNASAAPAVSSTISDAPSTTTAQQASTPGPWASLEFGFTGLDFLDFSFGEMTTAFDDFHRGQGNINDPLG